MCGAIAWTVVCRAGRSGGARNYDRTSRWVVVAGSGVVIPSRITATPPKNRVCGDSWRPEIGRSAKATGVSGADSWRDRCRGSADRGGFAPVRGFLVAFRQEAYHLWDRDLSAQRDYNATTKGWKRDGMVIRGGWQSGFLLG